MAKKERKYTDPYLKIAKEKLVEMLRSRDVRAIKSLNEDIRLNRALWKLTESLASQL